VLRHVPGLNAELQAREVRLVHIVGLALDVCVRWSALDAARLGYRVTVLRSATAATGIEQANNAEQQLKQAGVAVVG